MRYFCGYVTHKEMVFIFNRFYLMFVVKNVFYFIDLYWFIVK